MPINSEIKQGTKIKPIPKPKPEIGVDTSQDFTKDLIDAVEAGYANLSDLDSFSVKAQTREQLYTLIDAMVQDGRVSAVLETYAEDITAPNNQGDIIWVESENSSIRDYVSYLLKSLEVNKNIFSWTYNLLKYGDVYLELFTEKDVDDESTKVGNKKGVSKPLNEDIKINISNPNNKLINYVEMVNNPAEMFELTKFGQTVSYIKAPVAITNVSNASSVWDNYMTYKMRNTDVLVYDSLKFVHGYLSTDNASRVPEEVRLFDNDKDYDNDENYDSYKIKKGQSILFNNFKIWRELSLLEDSILLNRLTRSGYINFLMVEVGDMPKDRVQLTLQGLKDKIEQKTALNSGKSMQEYTNPGPINNVIYLPTRNGVGNVTSFTLGGDVDPKQLTDLNWFLNSFYGNFRVPKQFFCLRGDTKLTLLNGEEISIKEMYDNRDEYLNKGILSCKEDGTLEPTKIKDIMLTRKNASFVRVYLDNDTYIDTTPDHRFMLRDGSYKEAQYLTNEDSLMPYYERITKDGRKEVLDNNTGKYKLQYRLVAETKFNNVEKGHQIHHVDCNKLNDDFDNLENLTLEEHCKRHEKMLHHLNKIRCEENRKQGIKHGNCDKFSVTNGRTNMWLNKGDSIPDGFYKGQTCNYTETGKKTLAESARKMFTNKEPWNKGLTKDNNELVKNIAFKSTATKKEREQQGLYEESKKHANQLKREWAKEHYNEMREAQLKRYDESRWVLPRTLRCPICGKIFTKELNQEEYNQYLNKERFIGCCKEHTKEISGYGKLGRSYKLLRDCNFDYSKYDSERQHQSIRQDAYYKGDTIKNVINRYNLNEYVTECNHKVIKVEKLDIIEDAYDIEVESSNHNFVLTNGIFIHNCETDDSTGFNGGTSLTIISSRYAKTIVRYQNAVKQFITDLINVFLVKRGLVGYINKFKICMQAPTTQEEIDRRDAEKSQLDLIQNVTAQFSNLFTLEPSQATAQAKVLKTMLSNTVSYSGILTILDELILKWEQEEKEKKENEEEGTQEQQEVNNEVPSSEENIKERNTPTTMDFEEETVEEEPVETSEEEEVESENSENSYLPSFDELNINGTDL